GKAGDTIQRAGKRGVDSLEGLPGCATGKVCQHGTTQTTPLASDGRAREGKEWCVMFWNWLMGCNISSTPTYCPPIPATTHIPRALWSISGRNATRRYKAITRTRWCWHAE